MASATAMPRCLHALSGARDTRAVPGSRVTLPGSFSGHIRRCRSRELSREPISCRLSITHWGGTGRGEEQPRTPKAWHDSAPGRSAAGARGVRDPRPHGCAVGYPQPGWGAALGSHHAG